MKAVPLEHAPPPPSTCALRRVEGRSSEATQGMATPQLSTRSAAMIGPTGVRLTWALTVRPS